MNSNEDLTATVNTAATGIAKRTHYDKVKAVGILLLGLSAILGNAVMYSLEKENKKLNEELDCRSEKADDLNRAIGLGLVAVARDDSEGLQRQAEIVVQIAEGRQEECG